MTQDDELINEDDDEEQLEPLVWDIHREGRAWTADEFELRANRLIELKFEISRGKLFYSEETRLMILGMLLENVGIDAAVRLGDPERWKGAIQALDKGSAE